ncbi:BTB/POZ and MATH domain-containing protein 2 [Abeliophyllum distichum]|uniref:BTB/POZ and MATH domain-containing protein 2 n=1 Tax=Abeliophyllum distichum TaxID=126358 RepID=A0ABD1TYC9_9LAMI
MSFVLHFANLRGVLFGPFLKEVDLQICSGQATNSTEDAIKDLCFTRPVLADLSSKDKQLDAQEQGTGYSSRASSSTMISFELSSGSPSGDHTPASIDADKYVGYHLDNVVDFSSNVEEEERMFKNLKQDDSSSTKSNLIETNTSTAKDRDLVSQNPIPDTSKLPLEHPTKFSTPSDTSTCKHSLSCASFVYNIKPITSGKNVAASHSDAPLDNESLSDIDMDDHTRVAVKAVKNPTTYIIDDFSRLKNNKSPSVSLSSTSYTEKGSHSFEISGYSLVKGIGVGKHIASDSFMVGGHLWAIYFYPDGKELKIGDNCISCFIARVSEGEGVRALFKLELLGQSEKGRHIRLESLEESDVEFEVEGEIFAAHKLVLAARSPVFKAQLFGAFKDQNKKCIRVEDMKAPVFKIWKKSFSLNSRWAKKTVMSQHLLSAADRYGLQRLRLLCDARIKENIAINTVASSLALAEQHNSQLKSVSIEFITQPENLKAVMQTEGFDHLKESCPSIITDLLEYIAKRVKCSDISMDMVMKQPLDCSDTNRRVRQKS